MNILKILIIISSFLFQIFHVKAEILDGGEIRFNGFVTDEAPKWTWQVAAHDQTWRVDTANARIENKELVFNLRDKGSLPFLEGHLFEVAERGGQALLRTLRSTVMESLLRYSKGKVAIHNIFGQQFR